MKIINNKKISSVFLFTMFSNLKFSRALLMIYCLGIGINVVQFAIIQSVYSIFRFAFEIPSGIIADKFKKNYVLSLATLISGLVYIFLFFAKFINIKYLFISLLIAFSIEAFTTTLISGTDQALLYETLSEKSQKEKFVKYLSFIQIVSLLCLSISTMLGGSIANVSISFAFLLQGLFSICASIIILTLHSQNNDSMSKVNNDISEICKSGISTLKRQPSLIMVILFFSIIELNVNSITVFIQGYFQSINIDIQIITIIIGSTTICSVFGALMASRFSKLRMDLFICFSSVILLISTCLLIFDHISIIIIGFALLNILIDLIIPGVSKYINDSSEAASRATMISVMSFISGLLSAVLYPFFGASITNFGYTNTFFGIGVGSFILLIILLFTFISRGEKRSEN